MGYFDFVKKPDQQNISDTYPGEQTHDDPEQEPWQKTEHFCATTVTLMPLTT